MSSSIHPSEISATNTTGADQVPPATDIPQPTSLPSVNVPLRVVVLQHPQEPKEARSTSPQILRDFSNAKIRIGLSWPNLRRAIDDESAQPNEWAVLYLGSGKGASTPDVLSRKSLRGIIILDGTWSQAKTLWWRNAWLLKLTRVALLPTRSSIYHQIRKEPRKECLSSYESIIEAQKWAGLSEASTAELSRRFAEFVRDLRVSKKPQKTPKLPTSTLASTETQTITESD